MGKALQNIIKGHRKVEIFGEAIANGPKIFEGARWGPN